jgi:hypothetical protein
MKPSLSWVESFTIEIIEIAELLKRIRALA